MPILLGIDTGGTYTDAVLLDKEKGILATAKSPTTRPDLAIGIRNTVKKILTQRRLHVNLVSLSSTLATNAIVESKGKPAGLILIGYDPDILEQDVFQKIDSGNPLSLVRGGHRISGDEQAPLDIKSLKEAISAHANRVNAFAVSGYFSVRNPSHELAGKALIKEMTGLPVTCGHELTTNLDAPRRAITALLNARLIPLIHELIHSVSRVMADFNIDAPLMIVKGDGSLISAETALDVPIETIMSGPAASVIGARYLTGFQDALVIDMGGTTSDMALLKNGTVVAGEERTAVGGFHPMVESIDVLTQGIGGDSDIHVSSENDIQIGPMRVVPLCVLGSRYPDRIEMLKSNTDNSWSSALPLFIVEEKSSLPKKKLPERCNELLDLAAEGPLFIPRLLEKVKYPSVYAQTIEFLIKEGLVGASSFTPTDAVTVLNHYKTGSTKAACYGAGLIAARLDMDVEALCKAVIDLVQYNLSSAIVCYILRADNHSGRINVNATDSFFIDLALRKDRKNLLNCAITLGCRIVAVGAPAGTYIPGVASLLNCGISIPDNAEVANAVGSVTGTISQTVRILIKPIHVPMAYRVHTPEGVTDFSRYQDAELYARDTAERIAGERARLAGADKIEIDLVKKNYGAKIHASDKKPETLVQTDIVATAVGRPRLGTRTTL
ncbi:MAG: hydantoinase/oxoprolinase family protein [Deltaproteobacteria bacterium]|nr:hydantoinase/oxoprolinase family protein [Deltaproteobacteria bacterium]